MKILIQCRFSGRGSTNFRGGSLCTTGTLKFDFLVLLNETLDDSPFHLLTSFPNFQGMKTQNF
jgi:hypothetical protein